MANNTNKIDKELSEILETLGYLHMVIKNLIERHKTFALDVGSVDERLFHEITRYEILTENLKKTFLKILVNDAKNIAGQSVKDTNFYEKACETINRINTLLHTLDNHEKQDIGKSKSLKKMSVEARKTINDIKNKMDKAVNGIVKEKSGIAKAEFKQFK